MTAVTFQSLAVLLLSGIVVGMLVDGVRLLKERMPSALAVHWYFVEFIVWMGCGVFTFYLLYNWQDGHWRWLNFLAQLIGIFLYDRYIFRIIRLMIRIIVYSIITPIAVFSTIIWKIMLLLFYFALRILNVLKFLRVR